jgi:voltage-gated potassium channel
VLKEHDTMRQYLKSIIELNDNPKSRIFAYAIQGLILVSIISFSFETVPDLELNTRKLLRIIEIFCVVVLLSSISYAFIARITKENLFSVFFGL